MSATALATLARPIGMPSSLSCTAICRRQTARENVSQMSPTLWARGKHAILENNADTPDTNLSPLHDQARLPREIGCIAHGLRVNWRTLRKCTYPRQLHQDTQRQPETRQEGRNPGRLPSQRGRTPTALHCPHASYTERTA